MLHNVAAVALDDVILAFDLVTPLEVFGRALRPDGQAGCRPVVGAAEGVIVPGRDNAFAALPDPGTQELNRSRCADGADPCRRRRPAPDRVARPVSSDDPGQYRQTFSAGTSQQEVPGKE